MAFQDTTPAIAVDNTAFTTVATITALPVGNWIGFAKSNALGTGAIESVNAQLLCLLVSHPTDAPQAGIAIDSQTVRSDLGPSTVSLMSAFTTTNGNTDLSLRCTVVSGGPANVRNIQLVAAQVTEIHATGGAVLGLRPVSAKLPR